jgi:hypothetical protein
MDEIIHAVITLEYFFSEQGKLDVSTSEHGHGKVDTNAGMKSKMVKTYRKESENVIG